MTAALRPFLSYYGGKWMIARRYPPPLSQTIIEPFAGAAGYSTRYPDRQVILVDSNPAVAGVWDYLIRTPAREITRLPLLEPGQTTTDLRVCQEARWLIGWWVNKGAATPHLSLSAWAREPRYASQFWGPKIRARIASQVDRIRHWRVIHGHYTEAPTIRDATWFIDPPYQSDAGRRYPHNRISYPALAAWCKARTGQIIVCEHEGADWLPFTPIGQTYSTVGRRTAARATPREMIWTAERWAVA